MTDIDRPSPSRVRTLLTRAVMALGVLGAAAYLIDDLYGLGKLGDKIMEIVGNVLAALFLLTVVKLLCEMYWPWIRLKLIWLVTLAGVWAWWRIGGY
ncbi:hypothetical protein [Bosea sp. ANAM02]|uniref:hypothetical protein n=1 Tax=Bosea sp. ANAM02 TaxID=2020412 RepID=UPI00140EE560|nr:hypothetical protein [Bosea sp. ANAM02]BCB22030.1 hypothetical protein OCUBac02_49240 [Bosea sp. ANAM02]